MFMYINTYTPIQIERKAHRQRQTDRQTAIQRYVCMYMGCLLDQVNFGFFLVYRIFDPQARLLLLFMMLHTEGGGLNRM